MFSLLILGVERLYFQVDYTWDTWKRERRGEANGVGHGGLARSGVKKKEREYRSRVSSEREEREREKRERQKRKIKRERNLYTRLPITLNFDPMAKKTSIWSNGVKSFFFTIQWLLANGT